MQGIVVSIRYRYSEDSVSLLVGIYVVSCAPSIRAQKEPPLFLLYKVAG